MPEPQLQSDPAECPGCGCNDSAVIKTVVRWGQALPRRRCNNCGLTWTQPTPPIRHEAGSRRPRPAPAAASPEPAANGIPGHLHNDRSEMSVADINSKISEAVAAQEAGDYATALTKLRSAKMLLAGISDQRDAMGNEMKWDRAAIDKMIEDLQAQQSATLAPGRGAIRRTKIVYKRVRNETDCY
jgi:hypothetical protein